MPTYAYRCIECGARHDCVMSMRAYIDTPPQPYHCGRPMQRHIEAPALAMVGESHYDGLRASDGTDISTRAKHRRYMKERNLTTVDDFQNVWKDAARKREQMLAGIDAERPGDIARAIEKLGG